MENNINSAILKAENELLTLPRDYTPEMALKNNDILSDRYSRSYNIERLFEFIQNFKKGIPDYIRITTFGMDSPAVVKIVQYNGDIIIITDDHTRYPYANKIDNYFGDVIDIKTYRLNEYTVTDYDLLTFDNRDISIFKDILI
jgi:hypothetical protein